MGWQRDAECDECGHDLDSDHEEGEAGIAYCSVPGCGCVTECPAEPFVDVAEDEEGDA